MGHCSSLSYGVVGGGGGGGEGGVVGVKVGHVLLYTKVLTKYKTLMWGI